MAEGIIALQTKRPGERAGIVGEPQRRWPGCNRCTLMIDRPNSECVGGQLVI